MVLIEMGDRLHILMLRLGLYEVNARERVKHIERLRKKLEAQR